MTNENELNVGDVTLQGLNGLILSFDRRYGGDNQGSNTCMIAIDLIKSQQSHIEVLESAIREFLKCDLRCELSSFNHESCEGEDELRYIARTNLEKLIENKS